MDTSPPPLTVESLLAQSDWVRSLARGLVGEAGADDLVQDTWVAALERPPRRPGPLRPWLAGVVRNLARMRRRGDLRRERRERVGARGEGLPDTAELVAQVELTRNLARHVLDLAEPYRTTLLLRYWRHLSSAEIAKRQALPPGTVRSRLKRGLDELRSDLDESCGGREGWTLALTPLLRLEAPAAGVAGSLLPTTVAMKALEKTLIVAVALLLVLAGVGIHRLLTAPATDTIETAALTPGERGDAHSVPGEVELGAAPGFAETTPTAKPEPIPELPREPEPAAPPAAAPEPAPETAAPTPPLADVVMLGPRPGLRLRKTFENEVSLGFGDVEIATQDGSVAPHAIQDLYDEVRFTARQRLVVEDEYVAVAANGEITDLRRTFESITWTAENAAPGSDLGSPVHLLGTEEFATDSPLVGVRALFQQVGSGSDRYRAEPAEPHDPRATEGFDSLSDERRRELLDGLSEDLDLRAFVPQRWMEPGASWRVRGEELEHVLAPGGDLALKLRDNGRMLFVALPGVQSLPELVQELGGRVRVEYARVEERGEKRIAILELEVELVSEDNVLRRLLKSRRPVELPLGFETLKSFSYEWALEATGTLEWDLDGGHASRLELEGEVEARWRVRPKATDYARVDMEMSGEFVIRARFEPVE